VFHNYDRGGGRGLKSISAKDDGILEFLGENGEGGG